MSYFLRTVLCMYCISENVSYAVVYGFPPKAHIQEMIYYRIHVNIVAGGVP